MMCTVCLMMFGLASCIGTLLRQESRRFQIVMDILSIFKLYLSKITWISSITVSVHSFLNVDERNENFLPFIVYSSNNWPIEIGQRCCLFWLFLPSNSHFHQNYRLKFFMEGSMNKFLIYSAILLDCLVFHPLDGTTDRPIWPIVQKELIFLDIQTRIPPTLAPGIQSPVSQSTYYYVMKSFNEKVFGSLPCTVVFCSQKWQNARILFFSIFIHFCPQLTAWLLLSWHWWPWEMKIQWNLHDTQANTQLFVTGTKEWRKKQHWMFVKSSFLADKRNPFAHFATVT